VTRRVVDAIGVVIVNALPWGIVKWLRASA
jgi:hypothetical protein